MASMSLWCSAASLFSNCSALSAIVSDTDCRCSASVSSICAEKECAACFISLSSFSSLSTMAASNSSTRCRASSLAASNRRKRASASSPAASRERSLSTSRRRSSSTSAILRSVSCSWMETVEALCSATRRLSSSCVVRMRSSSLSCSISEA
uniref:Putative secreted protein n=1 Tax=Ixodes ricinus TaxID=34613 RepID=A0A147BEP1_IXORI